NNNNNNNSTNNNNNSATNNNNNDINNNRPQTGDSSILGYIGLGVASAIGLFMINRKRKVSDK
ncbi:MAG: LPXTG cell wall anchor domain-containing protein, partial [Clostridium sp.]|nr:LPXTG cell wall anchor domain-containing protein [Clostridium sp.]